MNMQRTLTRILGVLGASALLLSATVIPAEASTPHAASDCPAGWFCIFDNTDFTGRMLQFQNGGPVLGDLGTYDFRDRAESWVNKTGYPVKLTDVHAFRLDDEKIVPSGSRSSNMGAWNNRVDRVTVLR